MSSADPAVVSARRPRSVGAHRRAGLADRVRTTQRWAIGVLTLATVALVAYVAFLLAVAWLFVAAFDAVTARRQGSVDVLSVASALAPVLLVGWCTGLATSAVLARGETLGARTAGVVAGSVGVVAGAVVVALTDLA